MPVCRACLAKPEPLAAEYYCVQCRTPFLSRFPLDDQGRCALCRRGVRGFDAAYSFGFYEDELRKLIHLFKYGRIQTLSAPLGRLLARALPREQKFRCHRSHAVALAQAMAARVQSGGTAGA